LRGCRSEAASPLYADKLYCCAGVRLLMPSKKRLNSVAHNIAHHALNGLSFTQPGLFETCLQAGVDCVVLDLLHVGTKPVDKRFHRIRYYPNGLRDKLAEILKAEGFGLYDLADARLTFHEIDKRYALCDLCKARLVTRQGSIHEDWVEFSGTRRFPDRTRNEGVARRQAEERAKLIQREKTAPIIYLSAKEPRGCVCCLIA